MKKTRDWVAPAVTTALLPPLWAVVSEWADIPFGWCALAVAGIYAAAGGAPQNAKRISGGCVMGTLWGMLATAILRSQRLPHAALLFLTLCVLGFLAVMLAEGCLKKYCMLPAWLGSWALALGIFGTSGESLGRTFFKLLLAMLAGVWYIGVFSGWITQKIQRGLGAK